MKGTWVKLDDIESEVQQYMTTGLNRQEAIEEIAYWNNVEGMLSQQHLTAR